MKINKLNEITKFPDGILLVKVIYKFMFSAIVKEIMKLTSKDCYENYI